MISITKVPKSFIYWYGSGEPKRPAFGPYGHKPQSEIFQLRPVQREVSSDSPANGGGKQNGPRVAGRMQMSNCGAVCHQFNLTYNVLHFFFITM